MCAELTKVCSRCKISKPLSDFKKDKSKYLGVRCECKECGKKMVEEAYQEKLKSYDENKLKKCNKCGHVKKLKEFPKNKRSKDLHHNMCNDCAKEYRQNYYKENWDKVQATNKKWRENHVEEWKEYRKLHHEKNKEHDNEMSKQYYQDNKEHVSKKHKEYYDNNREKVNEMCRKHYRENREYYRIKNRIWCMENPEKERLHVEKRRALRNKLENTLTNEEWERILDDFNYSCALSEYAENMSLEHFVPLTVGHCGTTKENCYPMESSLNSSKNGKNPFEWIKTQPVQYQHEFYHKLLPHLASINNMTIREYKNFVNWCFDNPRTIDQIEKDNEKGLTSIDLYKQSCYNENMAS